MMINVDGPKLGQWWNHQNWSFLIHCWRLIILRHTHTPAHILKENYNKQLNSEALNVFIVQQALLGDAVPTTSATKALLLAYGKNRKPATKHDVLVHGITALSTVSILSSSLPDPRDPETLRDLQSLDEGSEHNTDIIISYHILSYIIIYYHILSYIIIYHHNL